MKMGLGGHGGRGGVVKEGNRNVSSVGRKQGKKGN